MGSVLEGRALLSICVRFSKPSHFVISSRGLEALRHEAAVRLALVSTLKPVFITKRSAAWA